LAVFCTMIALMMETVSSSETSLNINQTTRRSIPEDNHLHARRTVQAHVFMIQTPSPRRRWEDNIKMDLREIELENVYWIHLAQNRDRWWAL
jgi:hypothetical protein